jgi:hypothetical protein
MPAYKLDFTDPKTFARLLTCLVMHRGGEIRLPASAYDSYERGRLLVLDYDKEKGDLVLRVTSDFGYSIVVPPENSQWIRPQEEIPRERAQIQAERSAQRRVIRSDEELAEFEEMRERESQLAREASEGKLPRTAFRVAPPAKQ